MGKTQTKVDELGRPYKSRIGKLPNGRMYESIRRVVDIPPFAEVDALKFVAFKQTSITDPTYDPGSTYRKETTGYGRGEKGVVKKRISRSGKTTEIPRLARRDPRIKKPQEVEVKRPVGRPANTDLPEMLALLHSLVDRVGILEILVAGKEENK